MRIRMMHCPKNENDRDISTVTRPVVEMADVTVNRVSSDPTGTCCMNGRDRSIHPRRMYER